MTAQPQENLLISGSDEFDQQAAAAEDVISRARAGYAPDAPDQGYFPKGESMVRQVYDDGLTALMYGEVGLVYAGTSPGHVATTFEHTPDKDRLFGRLANTALTFHTIITKTRAEADVEIDHVRRKHMGVRGTLREGLDPYPAGTPYSAFDPAMMLWTGAHIGNGLLAVREGLQGPLPDEQRDEFCEDFSRFTELFGLERSQFPQTYPKLQGYLEECLQSGELHLTEGARYIGKQILSGLPVSGAGVPLRALVINPVLRSVLPEPIREMYGVRYNKLDQARTRLAVVVARSISAVLPDAVKNEGVARSFALIKTVERSRVRRGKPHATVPENSYR